LWSGSGQEMNGVNNSGGLLGSYWKNPLPFLDVK
jgi:hypothetical protein